MTRRAIVFAVMLGLLITAAILFRDRATARGADEMAAPGSEPVAAPHVEPLGDSNAPKPERIDVATAAEERRNGLAVQVIRADGASFASKPLRLEYRSGQYVHACDVRVPDGARDGTMVTDARGEVVLADTPPRPFWLVGQIDGLTGILELDPAYFDSRPCPPLLLRPDRAVEVLVRDAGGAPAPGLQVEALGGLCVSPARNWTEDDGIARFAVTCIDRALYEGPGIGVEVHPQSHGVLPHFNLNRPPVVAWATEGPTRIHAQVGAQRMARIMVLDGGADTSAIERTVEWSAEHDRGPGRRAFKGSRVAISGLVGDEITFTIEEPGRRPSAKTVAVPAMGGPVVVEVPRGTAAATLRLHLVDADKSPVARQRVFVYLPNAIRHDPDPEPDASEQSPFSSRLRITSPYFTDDILLDTQTDGAGRVDFEVDPGRAVDVMVRQCGVGHWDHATDWSRTTLVHPPLSAGESRDVTVAFPAAPALVSGVVLAADGTPVDGATVTIFPKPADDAPVGARGFVRCFTDPDGAFRVPGTCPAPSAYLRAIHDLHGRSELLELAPGSTGLGVRMVPFGRVAGTIVRRGATIGMPATVTLRPSDGREPEPPAWQPQPDFRTLPVPDDGSFVIAGVPPGTYDVSIGFDETVALDVPRVVVEPGRDTRDPRLAAAEVGAGLRLVAVSVRERSGVPIEDASVSLLPDGAKTPAMIRYTSPAGRVAFVIHEGGPVTIRVGADLHSEWSRACLDFPVDVVLDRLVTLDVMLETIGDLPTSWYCLILRHLDPVAAANTECRAWFGHRDRHIAVLAVEPGRHAIALRLSGNPTGFGTSTWESREAIDLGEITITPGVPPAPLKLRIDAAECRRILEAGR